MSRSCTALRDSEGLDAPRCASATAAIPRAAHSLPLIGQRMRVHPAVSIARSPQFLRASLPFCFPHSWRVTALFSSPTNPCLLSFSFPPPSGLSPISPNPASSPSFPCPSFPPSTPPGTSKEEVAGSPFVESLVERGYEVLFMTDPLDEYVMQVGGCWGGGRGGRGGEAMWF